MSSPGGVGSATDKSSMNSAKVTPIDDSKEKEIQEKRISFQGIEEKKLKRKASMLTRSKTEGVDSSRISTQRARRATAAAKSLAAQFAQLRQEENEDGEETFSVWGIFTSRTVIHHDDPGRHIWDWMITLLSIYSVISVPMIMAFPNVDTPAGLELVFDFIFFLDLAVCFKTSYVDDATNKEVMDSAQIRQHYLKGWFKVDFVAALPLDVILAPAFSQTSIMRELLKSNRLLRFARIVKKFNDFVESSAGRVFFLMSSFLVMAHLMGSFFFFIGRRQDPGASGGRWIDAERLVDAPFHFQYITSVYWALTTLGTVGYGDVTASSDIERLFTIMCMFLGAMIYATIFGTLTTVIQNLDRSANKYKDRVSTIKDFVTSNRLPPFIGQRLRAYLDASWNMRKRMAMSEVLNGVPELVSAEIMMFMFSDLIRKVPIFAMADRRFLEKVVRKFRAQVYLEGDILIREGDIGKELFFILSGHCDIIKFEASEELTLSVATPDMIVRNSKYLAERGPGSFVGEAALLSGAKRGATVVCKSDDLTAMYLLKEDFDEVIQEFPDVLDHIMEVSDTRKKAAAKAKAAPQTSIKVSPRQSFSAQMGTIGIKKKRSSKSKSMRRKRSKRQSIMSFGMRGRTKSNSSGGSSFAQEMSERIDSSIRGGSGSYKMGSGSSRSNSARFGSRSKNSRGSQNGTGGKSPTLEQDPRTMSPMMENTRYVMASPAQVRRNIEGEKPMALKARSFSEKQPDKDNEEPAPAPASSSNNENASGEAQVPLVRVRRRSLSMDTGSDMAKFFEAEAQAKKYQMGGAETESGMSEGPSESMSEISEGPSGLSESEEEPNSPSALTSLVEEVDEEEAD